ncbi:MAG TPA: trypsin-like peptidase domain-containing protein [Kofleriaceae bacterium]|jgi:S1-C subfamily serine protease
MAEPASAFQALDHALAAAVAAAGPGVVHVARGHHQGGSGIVWAPDLVLSTSFHTPDRTVVGVPTDDGELQGSGAPGPRSVAEGRREGSIDRRDAEVIGRDPGTDVALLRVTGAPLTPATFREIDGLAVGNLALALGRPGRSVRASLRAIGVLGGALKTPHGGTLDRYVESDRQIPRGFAGGPLVDGAGAVVGMNTRTLVRGADVAVTVATLRRVVAELVAHGGVRKGYLGVAAVPVQLPAAIAQAVGRERGALVAAVEDGAAAAAAGLAVGDLVVEIGGAAVTGPESLRDAIHGRPGDAVTVVVYRAGAKAELAATIGSRS